MLGLEVVLARVGAALEVELGAGVATDCDSVAAIAQLAMKLRIELMPRVIQSADRISELANLAVLPYGIIRYTRCSVRTGSIPSSIAIFGDRGSIPTVQR